MNRAHRCYDCGQRDRSLGSARGEGKDREKEERGNTSKAGEEVGKDSELGSEKDEPLLTLQKGGRERQSRDHAMERPAVSFLVSAITVIVQVTFFSIHSFLGYFIKNIFFSFRKASQ